MIFNNQNWPCHPERSEGSDTPGTEILSAAKDDILLPILGVKVHHRPSGQSTPYPHFISKVHYGAGWGRALPGYVEINGTASSASRMPMACMRVARSRKTNAASSTVAAG